MSNDKHQEAHGPVRALVGRIREYLANGGLFNPELMDHEKVRDLLMDVMEHLIKEEPK